jgi:primary-amine oxidase
MPVDYAKFTLKPHGFFGRNPALNIPAPDAAAHCAPGAHAGHDHAGHDHAGHEGHAGHGDAAHDHGRHAAHDHAHGH